MEKIEEVAKNKLDAVNMARDIFGAICCNELSSYNPEELHQLCVKQFPNFSKAFPLILAKMCERRYNEIAFGKFLDKLYEDPGKGMQGLIERQADYVRFLYYEECKLHKRHYDRRVANEIWNIEYQDMNKWMKKIQQQEKDAKNEFAEEEARHEVDKKSEFLDWLMTCRDSNPADESVLEDLISYDLPSLPDPKKTENNIAETAFENKCTIITQEPTYVSEKEYAEISKRAEIEKRTQEKIWDNAVLQQWRNAGNTKKRNKKSGKR